MTNFQPLEDVGRGSETQLQVAEKSLEFKWLNPDGASNLILRLFNSLPTKLSY